MGGCRFIVILILNLLQGVPGDCWQYFTKFSDLTMTGTAPDYQITHSEYLFGDCKREGIIYYTTMHLLNIDVLGKIIIRGWIDVKRIPTCIVLRAYAQDIDLFRSTAFNFQFCVPRITYCHTRKIWKYYFYEWYIPTDFAGGMDWDIHFYGPPSAEWQ